MVKYTGRLQKEWIKRAGLEFEENGLYVISSKSIGKPLVVRGREVLDSIEKLEKERVVNGVIAGPIGIVEKLIWEDL
jgi:hypothetical protein